MNYKNFKADFNFFQKICGSQKLENDLIFLLYYVHFIFTNN